jgi:hypothetical protein
MRYLLILIVAFCLSSSVSSEELFIKNRAFQGASSGSGQSMYVEAGPLAEALGIETKELNGGLLIGSGGEDLAGEQVVVVNGQIVPSQAGEGGVLMVHLHQAANALQAKMVHNKDFGTFDLYLDAKEATGDTTTDDWDKGWQRDVSKRSIPEGPLRGKIGDGKFELVQATSFGSTVTLKGPRQTVSLILLKKGIVSGEEVKIAPEDRVHGNHIRLEWVDENGQTQKDSYMSDYSMHLVMEDPVDGEVQAGIYLTLPDRSLLKGHFSFPVK